jgi:hypothetical protein
MRRFPLVGQENSAQSQLVSRFWQFALSSLEGNESKFEWSCKWSLEERHQYCWTVVFGLTLVTSKPMWPLRLSQTPIAIPRKVRCALGISPEVPLATQGRFSRLECALSFGGQLKNRRWGELKSKGDRPRIFTNPYGVPDPACRHRRENTSQMQQAPPPHAQARKRDRRHVHLLTGSGELTHRGWPTPPT